MKTFILVESLCSKPINQSFQEHDKVLRPYSPSNPIGLTHTEYLDRHKLRDHDSMTHTHYS